MQQNPSYRESLGNWFPYFFNSIGAFFYQIPMFWYTSSYVKCMGCPINLPLHGKMMQNSSNRESLGNGYPLFSLSLGSFFSIRFPCYGILHHMWNPWVSQSISHNMGKYSKIHRVGRAWEIGTHDFLIAYLLFFYQISILWYTSLALENAAKFVLGEDPVISVSKPLLIMPSNFYYMDGT